ncbi:MAG: hypothetical protein IPJ76_15785 [Flavobacteriales bacterium]|nr:MAG: hypothetical protein IPJ76_15785 [Flavobacteriales bacterium]
MMKHTLIAAGLLGSKFAHAQQPMPAPTDFDFWLGEWKLTWDGGTGTNSITKEMNGLLIHERFTDPKENYHGESWTMWDAQHRLWKQTWVDDQGNYMTFEGGPAPEGMLLTTYLTDKKDGVRYLYHMVFADIAPNTFNWTWKRSADDGKTWEVKWAIRYDRVR